jgi:hypothetical protein
MRHGCSRSWPIPSLGAQASIIVQHRTRHIVRMWPDQIRHHLRNFLDPTIPLDGIVNLLEISAESADEVGRWPYFEAIFRPKVGHRSLMIRGNTRRVEEVLPPTH